MEMEQDGLKEAVGEGRLFKSPYKKIALLRGIEQRKSDHEEYRDTGSCGLNRQPGLFS